jgi:hypothetical protein
MGGEVARAKPPTPNPSPFTGRGIQKAEWVFLCKAARNMNFGGLPTEHFALRINYFKVRRADITMMIATPDGPTFSVPTITASPSLMLMSVFSPVLS